MEDLQSYIGTIGIIQCMSQCTRLDVVTAQSHAFIGITSHLDSTMYFKHTLLACTCEATRTAINMKAYDKKENCSQHNCTDENDCSLYSNEYSMWEINVAVLGDKMKCTDM